MVDARDVPIRHTHSCAFSKDLSKPIKQETTDLTQRIGWWVAALRMARRKYFHVCYCNT